MRTWQAFWMIAALAGCDAHGAAHRCGTCRPRLDASETMPAGTELTLQAIRIERNGADQRLQLDTAIYTGDKIAFVLATPEPLWLYLVNITSEGSESLVWSGETNPHEPQRVPESGWFALAPPSGPELAVFIARRSAFPANDVLSFARREAGRTDLTRIQAAHPPGFFDDGRATMGLRGPSLRLHGTHVSAFDADDDVVLVVDLDHRSAE